MSIYAALKHTNAYEQEYTDTEKIKVRHFETPAGRPLLVGPVAHITECLLGCPCYRTVDLCIVFVRTLLLPPPLTHSSALGKDSHPVGRIIRNEASVAGRMMLRLKRGFIACCRGITALKKWKMKYVCVFSRTGNIYIIYEVFSTCMTPPPSHIAKSAGGVVSPCVLTCRHQNYNPTIGI